MNTVREMQPGSVMKKENKSGLFLGQLFPGGVVNQLRTTSNAATDSNRDCSPTTTRGSPLQESQPETSRSPPCGIDNRLENVLVQRELEEWFVGLMSEAPDTRQISRTSSAMGGARQAAQTANPRPLPSVETRIKISRIAQCPPRALPILEKCRTSRPWVCERECPQAWVRVFGIVSPGVDRVP